MSPVSAELAPSVGPNICVSIDGLIPGSNPIRVARPSLSNRFTVKANLSLSNSLRDFGGNRVVLKSIEDSIEVDWIGDDDIAPLVGGKGWLPGLVEKVLVDGLPGPAGSIPGAERAVDLDED